MDGDLKINGITPIDIKLGSLQVQHVFVGATHVWPPDSESAEFTITNSECCVPRGDQPLFELDHSTCCKSGPAEFTSSMITTCCTNEIYVYVDLSPSL